MGDTAKLFQGPVQVLYNAGSDVDVGFTKDGVHLEYEPLTMDLMVDQLGDTPAKTVLTGAKATVKFSLAEYSLDNLKLAFANMVPLQDDVDANKKRLEIRPLAGKVPASKKWIFKPIDPATGAPTTDKNHWLTIPVGRAMGPANLDYEHRTQRLIPVTIMCHPDTDANKNRLFFFGDETAVDANESGF